MSVESPTLPPRVPPGPPGPPEPRVAPAPPGPQVPPESLGPQGPPSRPDANPNRQAGIIVGSLAGAGLICAGAMLITMAALPVLGWVVAGIGALIALDVLGDACLGFSWMRKLTGNSLGEWMVTPFMPRPEEPRRSPGVQLRGATPPRAATPPMRTDGPQPDPEPQEVAPRAPVVPPRAPAEPLPPPG